MKYKDYVVPYCPQCEYELTQKPQTFFKPQVKKKVS